MNFTTVFIIYLIVINIIGFVAFALDKQKAIHHQWRTRESSLFLLTWLGGGLGCLLGMYFFHHKTRHTAFRIGIPAIMLLEIAGFCLFGTLTGCQQKAPQSEPVQALEKELDLLKGADETVVSKYLTAAVLFPDSQAKETVDSDIIKGFTAFFKDFDYKITGCTEKDDTAVVDVTLTTIDAQPLAKDFLSQSIVKQVQENATPRAVTYSLEDYYLSLSDLLTKNQYDTTTTKSSITLSKNDDKWTIDEGQNLDALLTGNFTEYVSNPDLFKPEEVVAIYLDTIKSFDKEQMNQFLSLSDMFSADEEYKRSISQALAAQIIKYLDYKITDSTNDGLTAQVTTDITSCDCHGIIQTYTEQVEEYTATSQALADGIDGRLTKANQILVDCINNNTAASSTEITLNLQNDGVSWQLKIDDTLAQAILGNIQEAVASVSTAPPAEVTAEAQ